MSNKSQKYNIGTCSVCGKEFEVRRSWAKFCSSACRIKNHYNKKYGGKNGTAEKSDKKNLAPKIVQKAAELYLRSSRL